MKTFALSIISILLNMGAAQASSPYGIFRVQSMVSNQSFHLVVTEDASILAPGAFLMEIPNYCGNPRLTDPQNVHIPFLKPSWNAQRRELSSRGNVGPYMNSVFLKMLEDDRVEGRFTTTNLNFAPARRGNDLAPIGFAGARIDLEQNLIRQAASSIVATEQSDEASGVYEGLLPDGMRVSLVLIRNNNGNAEYWDATFRLGNHEGIAMSSSADEAGLIRLVRAPGADIRVASGITGTVVAGQGGQLEFHGFNFVVRTGCITPMRLVKRARVLSR